MLKAIMCLMLTGCVQLSPSDVNRILTRIEKELDAVHASPTPENQRVSPRLPTGRAPRAEKASPAPSPMPMPSMLYAKSQLF